MQSLGKIPFFRYDLIRGLTNGVLDIGFSVFVLLIAIRWWEAPEFYKCLLVGGTSIGLFLTPIIDGNLSKLKLSDSRIAALLMAMTAVFLVLSVLTYSLLVFVMALVFSQICMSQVPNLMLGAYSRVYEKKERGKRVSYCLVLSTFGGLFASYWFGAYLDLVDSNFRMVLLSMGCSALISSFFLWKMSSHVPEYAKPRDSKNLNGFLNIILEDRIFLKILMAWMLLGFGAIMTFPLRIEYLSRESELALSNMEIALVAVIAFFSAKVISTFFWGKLFDGMHFIKFRVLLNLIMVTAILIYFNSTGLLGVFTGSIIAGVGMGGASLAWNLWVTKLAPAGREKEYMGVHMCFTGIRGFAAPFCGYWIEGLLGFTGVSLVSTMIILCSSVIFWSSLGEARFAVSK